MGLDPSTPKLEMVDVLDIGLMMLNGRYGSVCTIALIMGKRHVSLKTKAITTLLDRNRFPQKADQKIGYWTSIFRIPRQCSTKSTFHPCHSRA